ncbi:unnamed protein product [Closterium sp. Naga37s-1]|nr:unnamed protein product [Closterium sp. Naga37s-1]
MAMAGGMVRMVNGVPVKVLPAEVSGGMGREAAGGIMAARVAHLAAKLAQQEAATAALKREVDEMKRAMAMAKAEAAKGAAAKGAWDTGRQEGAANGNCGAESAAAGKAGDSLPAQTSERTNLVPLLDSLIKEHVNRVRSELESEMEGMEEHVEVVRRAAAVGALKAEIARMGAAAERLSAEVAYVRTTAAHTEARMNDVELAVAEWKSAREKTRAEMEGAEHSLPGGSAGEHAGVEAPEGKKRKREEAGNGTCCCGRLRTHCQSRCFRWRGNRGFPAAEVGELHVAHGSACAAAWSVKEGQRLAVLLLLWAKTAPQQAAMDLSGISCLTDAALTRLATFRQLTTVTLEDSSGFTAAGMVSGVPVKVRPGEVVGGMVRETAEGGMAERVEQLAAKLAQQEEATAALKREVDEMKRAMANADAAKGAAAKDALATGSQGETAKGKGGAESAAAGEAGDSLPAQLSERSNIRVPPLLGVRSEYESEVEGLKEQMEAVRREAADAVGTLKAEIARMRAAAERQAAEVAYVRATAAHTEARMNEVELAVAEWKSAREKARAEMERAEEVAGAGTPEGKKRKRDEAGKAEEMAHAAAGGCALIANRVACDGECDEGETKAALSGLQKAMDGLLRRVVNVEESGIDRGRVWEVLLTLWARTSPQQQATMNLSRISCLTDAALARLASNMKLLVKLGMQDARITARGVSWLKGLPYLQKIAVGAEDVEGFIQDTFPAVVVTPGPL